MPITLTGAYKTDVGKQREQNEDTPFMLISEDKDRGLFIVADGMGGYQAGEVASKLAVERISEALRNFFVPVPDQPTIKLSPSSVPDEDATVKMPTLKSEEPKELQVPTGRQSRTRKL